MNLVDYYRDVLVPANVAVEAIQRAGLPVDVERIRTLRRRWQAELAELEAYVEGEAAKAGTPFEYSEKHSADPVYIARFVYDGLKLERRTTRPISRTPTGQRSSGDEDLSEWASLAVPRPDDDERVRAVQKIRSLGGALSKYVDKFEETRRADGCCHPKYNWALRTARLSAEDPPVHQIPERADKEVADAVKGCIVPRVAPCPEGEIWDPRKHGSCFRWDIVGAEAAIRAAMLTDRYGVRDPVAWEYIRLGKDIHSKTASLLYGVAEGTYKKGTYERDQVGKQTFFAKQFGASWRTVKAQMWRNARIDVDDAEAKRLDAAFDAGYVGLTQLYDIDKILLGDRGYAEDAYGRRRRFTRGPSYDQIPDLAVFQNDSWNVTGGTKEERFAAWRRLNHIFHQMANTPTQSINATDNLWMLALCYHGEYVDLRVPPMWNDEIPFPEAAGWQLHGGSGPGGRDFQAWHMNTVHDSGWGDCAPGWLEPTAKLIWRRCRAVPLDWRLEADVPYRVELSVGPSIGQLMSYNKVAKEFGLEPVPDR